jgi:hypothetical protein
LKTPSKLIEKTNKFQHKTALDGAAGDYTMPIFIWEARDRRNSMITILVWIVFYVFCGLSIIFAATTANQL